MSPDLTLFIDTANANLAFACVRNTNTVLFSVNEYPTKGQAERLAFCLEQEFKKHNLALSQIKRIGCITGPGGFSGIRTALSLITGLVAVFPHIEIIPLTSLEGLARSATFDYSIDYIVACLNARRDSVYMQIFNPDYTPMSAPQMVLHQNIDLLREAYEHKKLFVIGHGIHNFSAHYTGSILINENDSLNTTNPEKLAVYCATCPDTRIDIPTAFYLREADAQLPQS